MLITMHTFIGFLYTDTSGTYTESSQVSGQVQWYTSIIVVSWEVMVYTVCTSEGVYVVLRAKPKEYHWMYTMTPHDTADLYLDHDQIRQPDSCF